MVIIRLRTTRLEDKAGRAAIVLLWEVLQSLLDYVNEKYCQLLAIATEQKYFPS